MSRVNEIKITIEDIITGVKNDDGDDIIELSDVPSDIVIFINTFEFV